MSKHWSAWLGKVCDRKYGIIKNCSCRHKMALLVHNSIFTIWHSVHNAQQARDSKSSLYIVSGGIFTSAAHSVLPKSACPFCPLTSQFAHVCWHSQSFFYPLIWQNNWWGQVLWRTALPHLERPPPGFCISPMRQCIRACAMKRHYKFAHSSTTKISQLPSR